MLTWPHMVAPGSATPLLHHIIKKQYLETFGNVQPCMEAAWGVEEPMAMVYIYRQVAQDLYVFAGSQVCTKNSCSS